MKHLNKIGMSLIEIMVAVAILATVLIALLALVITTNRSKEETIKQVVASNMARECIEVVRNKRDTNWMIISQRGNFLEGILNTGDSLNHAGIIEFNGDTHTINRTPSSSNFPGHNDFRMYLDGNIYRQDDNVIVGATPTGYYRIVYLNDICKSTSDCSTGQTGICEDSQNEGQCSEAIGLEVICEVDWVDSGKWKKVIISDRLYDWKY